MAEQPRQPGIPAQALKESSRAPPTPPPAYAPPPRRLQNSLISLFNQHPNLDILDQRGVQPSLFQEDNGEDEEDDTQDISPIAIRISTAVRISSNNNHVSLTATPADKASAIADAVVTAIKQASSANCGIPMIDEDGRPRPIRIEVDAGIDINGTGNVVGSEAVVHEIVRARLEARKRTYDQAVGDAAEQASRAKRARSV
ncbi:hypothetical protein NKR23_g10429 [Pleurostoma richardsiae]|uniref:Uncharacterized protein n=1 Tax=Pleurostoma richardsiae TaxID=41990 RepID=A0AA38VLL5_9PEZI|nr:hypothetical protein NKR23_g10429 [Pleurostoma richardsiae]